METKVFWKPALKESRDGVGLDEHSLITANAVLSDDLVELHCRIVWGITSHRTGKKFDLCYMLRVTMPEYPGFESIRGALFTFGRPENLFVKNERLIWTYGNPWRRELTRLANRVGAPEGDTSLIDQWLEQRLENFHSPLRVVVQ